MEKASISDMFEVLFIFWLGILGQTLAEIKTEAAVLKRLDATESLVRELLQEVQDLKLQDKSQKDQITMMKNELHHQHKRTSYLESLVRKLRADARQKSSVKTAMSQFPQIKQQSVYTDSGEAVNRIRRVENEAPIAFFAKMVNHLEHGGVHQTVIFEEVITNVGNAYKKDLGVFVAPLPGIYVFSTTLVSRHYNGAHAQFVKNGTALTTMYVSAGQSGSGDDTTSQTIVLQLEAGDDVAIQNLDSDKAFYGSGHSIFSGFLLEEDYPSSAIVGK